jgi:hypothetical protein
MEKNLDIYLSSASYPIDIPIRLNHGYEIRPAQSCLANLVTTIFF